MKPFDIQFFTKYQWLMLVLLNNRFTKRWARWILRIHKDCELNEQIVALLPNVYVVQTGRTTYRADFRTHEKFGKRIYRAFYPLWVAMHVWDLLGDTLSPKLSFGFGTLTQYPDAGTGSTTVDGNTERSATNETFSTINTGAGNGVNNTNASSSVFNVVAGSTTDRFNTIDKGIFIFDTSALGASVNIISGTFSLYGASAASTGLGDTDTDIVSTSSTATNSLGNADYQTVGSTRYATGKALSTVSTVAYNVYTLNSSGLAAISKTSLTRIAVQLKWCTDNSFTGTWSSGAGSSFAVYMADQAGTNNDPKLVVNYNVARKNIVLDSCIVRAATGDGLKIVTTNTVSAINCTFEQNGGYGVNIGAGCFYTRIIDNFFQTNTSGAVLDSGTSTIDANNTKV